MIASTVILQINQKVTKQQNFVEHETNNKKNVIEFLNIVENSPLPFLDRTLVAG